MSNICPKNRNYTNLVNMTKFSDICQNFSTFPDICFKLQTYAMIPQLAMAGRKRDAECIECF